MTFAKRLQKMAAIQFTEYTDYSKKKWFLKSKNTILIMMKIMIFIEKFHRFNSLNANEIFEEELF